MSHGIKKETYVEADHKTQSALTFDLLDKIYSLVDENSEIYKEHLGICDKRFKKVENNKRKDTAKSSLFGILGGFVAIIAIWLKDHL